MIDNILRTLIVGPIGAGKSQFCNFVQKDVTNSINKVRNSLESCTQGPKSNKFKELKQILILSIQLEIMIQMKMI